MRICHLAYDDIGNTAWLSGGGAVRAWEIYRRLARRHEVTLITGYYPGAARQEVREGVRFVRVGTDRSYALSRLSYSLGALAALKRLEWDVWVHEFSAFAPLFPGPALRRRGILFFYHFVGAHALKKHPLVGAPAWAAESWTLRAYQRILTISPSVHSQVKERLDGRRNSPQVECVLTGVDAGYFSLEPVEEDYLLYFGRSDIHTKGIDVLLGAFAALVADFPNLRLKMAGHTNPVSRRALEELVRQSGVGDRVDVLGGVEDGQKRELLRRALFVCMPSRYEGWGIVAVEAAAAGKAVVGTRVSGLVDAVRADETGLLVESGSVPQLEAAMRRLLLDRELRQGMGLRGREWARRFDWDNIAAEQEKVLAQIAAVTQ
jgi:glycogen synthase